MLNNVYVDVELRTSNLFIVPGIKILSLMNLLIAFFEYPIFKKGIIYHIGTIFFQNIPLGYQSFEATEECA